jgi:dolichol-phosphate mannosyltransferase
MERSIESEAQPLVSVVVPAFNEEGNIDLLYGAVSQAIGTTGLRFEILFVDDGSKDATLRRVLALHHRDPRVRPIALTRNFGHQAALVAGLEAARGDAVITMDCDLQHPPHLIPDMIAAWRRGSPIVQMIREDTLGASVAKRAVSRVFYKLINFLSDTPITPDAADFQLLDREALESLLKLGDSRPFLRGMVAWLGYPRTELRYTANHRPLQLRLSTDAQSVPRCDYQFLNQAAAYRILSRVSVRGAFVGVPHLHRHCLCSWEGGGGLVVIDGGPAFPGRYATYDLGNSWRIYRSDF